MEAKADVFLQSYYREHRRLPPHWIGLLDEKRLARILLRGELEHRTGLAWLTSQLTSRRQDDGQP